MDECPESSDLRLPNALINTRLDQDAASGMQLAPSLGNRGGGRAVFEISKEERKDWSLHRPSVNSSIVNR